MAGPDCSSSWVLSASPARSCSHRSSVSNTLRGRDDVKGVVAAGGAGVVPLAYMDGTFYILVINNKLVLEIVYPHPPVFMTHLSILGCLG